jgi:hypothetical protein
MHRGKSPHLCRAQQKLFTEYLNELDTDQHVKQSRPKQLAEGKHFGIEIIRGSLKM